LVGPEIHPFAGRFAKREQHEMDPIYMDHAATTPVRREVLEAMLPYFSECFGNASSVYKLGQDARKAVDHAREVVADCIRADPREIYFMSGGTESDNLAIKGIARANSDGKRHLVTSQVEHHAVLNTCKFLEKEGFEVTYLPVDRFGIVDPADLQDAIRDDTILVSVMLANNETGTMQAIPELAAIAKERGAAFHTDAVQAVGKMPVDVDELGVDLLSMSAHKIHGPKGIGALYVRRGMKIEPLLHGGHHEQGKRPGTENVAAIVGFGKAMELAREEMATTSGRLASLRDRLERQIRERIPNTYLNGHAERRLPNILNMSFEFVEGESLLLMLDMRGIAVSTGSACTSGALEPSHVLTAMGVDPAIAQGSLRFSLGCDNTEEQVDFVAASLVEIVARLRQMSPLYAERTAH